MTSSDEIGIDVDGILIRFIMKDTARISIYGEYLLRNSQYGSRFTNVDSDLCSWPHVWDEFIKGFNRIGDKCYSSVTERMDALKYLASKLKAMLVIELSKPS